MFKRLTMLAAALLACAMLSLSTDGYAQKPIEPAHQSVGSVAETRWAGRAAWDDGETRDWTLYFRSDGVLIYAYDGNTYDNGRWRQREMLINFDTNQYFALYVGHVYGSEMQGVMYNLRGQRGSFRFTRR